MLDWELCTVGDPLADVGLMVAYWNELGAVAGQAGRAVPGAGDRGRRLPDRAPSSRPSTRARPGAISPSSSFWIAFAYWKVAIIVEGVYRRWLNDPGNGSGAGELQPAVARLAGSRAPRSTPTRWRCRRERRETSAAEAQARRQARADPRGRGGAVRPARLRGDEVGRRRESRRHRLDRPLPLLRVEAALPLRDHGQGRRRVPRAVRPPHRRARRLGRSARRGAAAAASSSPSGRSSGSAC